MTTITVAPVSTTGFVGFTQVVSDTRLSELNALHAERWATAQQQHTVHAERASSWRRVFRGGGE